MEVLVSLVSVHTEAITTNLDWDHHKVEFSIVLNRLRVVRKRFESAFLELGFKIKRSNED